MEEAAKNKLIEGWNELNNQLQEFINDDTAPFGKRASMALDMLDMVLPALNKMDLLYKMSIDIVGRTNDNRKLHWQYKLIIPNRITNPDAESYVQKTEKEQSEL